MSNFPVCVIGNSHVAALRWAWIKSPPPVRDGVTLTFFASAAGDTDELALLDGVLVPQNEAQLSSFAATSGGQDRIVCKDYKAFVLVALGVSFRHAVEHARGYGTLKQREWMPVGQLISEACLLANLEATIESSASIRTRKRIGSVCDAPVLICPQPCPSETHAQVHADDPYWNGAGGFLPYFYERYRKATDAAVSRHGAETVWQHPSTMRMPGLTNAEFNAGSIKLEEDVPRQTKDTLHMNQAFGLLTLEDVFRRLDQLSDGAVLDRAA